MVQESNALINFGFHDRNCCKIAISRFSRVLPVLPYSSLLLRARTFRQIVPLKKWLGIQEKINIIWWKTVTIKKYLHNIFTYLHNSKLLKRLKISTVQELIEVSVMVVGNPSIHHIISLGPRNKSFPILHQPMSDIISFHHYSRTCTTSTKTTNNTIISITNINYTTILLNLSRLWFTHNAM